MKPISPPPLHAFQPWRCTVVNRPLAAIFISAVLALFYHHSQMLLHPPNRGFFFLYLALVFSDFLLAFMWISGQSLRIYAVCRKELLENLDEVLNTSDLPDLDVFICTADPYKEPPMSVVNTALSAMAYDYPPGKISVYVSDDGGSAMTLFAFMEAAKFAKHWLPFCRKKNVLERSPDDYFGSNLPLCPETESIKIMFEKMKSKVEHIVDGGKVDEEHIPGEEERDAFIKWKDEFTPQDHPTVIQVVLEKSKDKDVTGHVMPNLVYISREKRSSSPHHFKAGALNVLLRVSAVMTNAPIILTLDCDTVSNDPQTLRRMLCYFADHTIRCTLGYVQFPQKFRGVDKNDIYGCEFRHVTQMDAMGFDGLIGPTNLGTGCFFSRKVFFGCPSDSLSSEHISNHALSKPIQSSLVLEQAHHVAGHCYERYTKWGSKIGYRYGSITEDYKSSYLWHCEGWRFVFCNPDRPAFLGAAPMTLIDTINQNKRWGLGHLEVGFSKYCPLTYGIKALGPIMGLGYAQYAFWSIWSIPITVYAFLPQLAILNDVHLFPKVSEPWFFLYVFLILGTYVEDLVIFVITGGTFQKWWNDHRMWMIKGLTSYLFGLMEMSLKSLTNSSAFTFNVTAKVVEDDEQVKRYEKGLFEFGVPSPMFVPLTMAAVVNFLAFVKGFVGIFASRYGNNLDSVFMQLFISGFGVVNCWPIYEAIVLRSDKGKIPAGVTTRAVFLVWVLYVISIYLF